MKEILRKDILICPISCAMPFKWIFDLKELQTAILEENGRISFLAKSEHRPVSPSDLNLSPHKEWLLPTYIMDGKILYENLLHSGKDEEWLRKQLSAHGCKRLSDIFLATGINRIL